MPGIPLWTIATSLLAAAVVGRVFAFASARKKTRYLPGLRSAFTPISPFGALLPTSRYNPGLLWQWLWRNKVYPRFGTETISVLPYLFGHPAIYTCSLEVARQVVSTRGQFVKPDDTSVIVNLWGPNVFSANGSEWKRHRRIMAPAFGNETYAMVWKETCSLYQEMCTDEGWGSAEAIEIPSVNELTLKMALIIISRCGFGNPIPWDFSDSSNKDVSFTENLAIVSSSPLLRLLVPKWMYLLPIKRFQKLDQAYKQLAVFMQSLISSRRDELRSGGGADRRDVFSLMIRASDAEGKLAMSDDELSGNTFLLLFAGHESTAHTLEATMGFLALYQDIQQEVYQSIVDAVSAGAMPGFEDSERLYKVEACFIEAARLFPAGMMLIRDTAEDVVLTTYDQDGSTRQLPVEAGTRIVVDVVGTQYNPRHYPEPEEYRPSRWYNAHENDFSMFSLGLRACIGRRFALTEAVCFLALLLRDWKLEIILLPGETRAQWRARVMRATFTMTFGWYKSYSEYSIADLVSSCLQTISTQRKSLLQNLYSGRSDIGI